MVNFGFNSASILGIFLAVAGAGLYFMRTFRPELSRDHDIFFAAVGLLSGLILIFQGWRLDPILQFSQLLLAGTAVFFAAETIKLRGFTTQQARRNNPFVDPEEDFSPSSKSRVYRAELAQNDFYEEEEEDFYEKRRLQGTRERKKPRNQDYEEDQPRSNKPSRSPRSPRRSSTPPSPGYSETTPSRRQNDPRNRNNEWDDSNDHWEDQPSPPTRRSKPSKERYEDDTPTIRGNQTRKKRRPKSAEDLLSSVGTEYVDYQPMDDNEEKETKSPPKPTNSNYNDEENNESDLYD